jgi:Family of unknown function (DUF6521)
MRPWSARPIEVRNLLNPAFCGLVLVRALRGYEENDVAGMPFSLSLLVLPLCLHKETRGLLAGHARSYLLKALSDNPQLLVGFPQRTTVLIPYSHEALAFAMNMGCFNVTDTGRLKTRPRGIRQSLSGTDESVACQKVARFVGKQFANISDRATIYTALGVRP